MYVWHVCNKLQKWPLANKWCLRVIALHSRTWVTEGLPIPSHWSHARAVKWARNWKNIKNIGRYEWLPGVSKPGPFSCSRPNWRKERATAREQASTVARTSISGETPLQMHRESLKTSCLPFLPTGAKRSALSKRQTSQPPAKRQSFLFLRVTSTAKGKSAWKRRWPPLRSSFLRKATARPQQGTNRRNSKHSHWLCLEMLPNRENSHRSQRDTTWRQEDHRTLCHSLFHRRPVLPGEVTEDKQHSPAAQPASSHGHAGGFTRRTSGPPRKTETFYTEGQSKTKPHHSDNIWLVPRER